jgi:hypothetical protein
MSRRTCGVDDRCWLAHGIRRADQQASLDSIFHCVDARHRVRTARRLHLARRRPSTSTLDRPSRAAWSQLLYEEGADLLEIGDRRLQRGTPVYAKASADAVELQRAMARNHVRCLFVIETHEALAIVNILKLALHMGALSEGSPRSDSSGADARKAWRYPELPPQRGHRLRRNCLRVRIRVHHSTTHAVQSATDVEPFERKETVDDGSIRGRPMDLSGRSLLL